MKIKIQKYKNEKDLDSYYQNQFLESKQQHCRTYSITSQNQPNININNTLRKMSTVTSKGFSVFSDFNKKHRSYTIHAHRNRSSEKTSRAHSRSSNQSAHLSGYVPSSRSESRKVSEESLSGVPPTTTSLNKNKSIGYLAGSISRQRNVRLPGQTKQTGKSPLTKEASHPSIGSRQGDDITTLPNQPDAEQLQKFFDNFNAQNKFDNNRQFSRESSHDTNSEYSFAGGNRGSDPLRPGEKSLPAFPPNFNRSRRGSALSSQILFLRLQDRRRSSNPMIEHLRVRKPRYTLLIFILITADERC